MSDYVSNTDSRGCAECGGAKCVKSVGRVLLRHCKMNYTREAHRVPVLVSLLCTSRRSITTDNQLLRDTIWYQKQSQ